MVAFLVLVLVGGAHASSWVDLVIPTLSGVCIAVVMLRGRPGERLLVASVGLPLLVLFGFSLLVAGWS